MTEISADQLRQAVEARHGGRATFVQAVPVHEEHGGQAIWNGMVHVFDLAHQPEGHWRAYAWSRDAAGGKRIFAALHGGRVKSPKDAVRTANMAQAGNGDEG